jgi:S-methylmethionine-dependent homocysteine/selenocysteine methylase
MTRLEQLMTSRRAWLADGGLETAMIYHKGLDLPQFAAFTLLERDEGRAALSRYFESFIALAKVAGTGFVLDTATWRANMGWASAMGLDAAGITAANGMEVDFAKALRALHETAGMPILINGVIRPACDGYVIDRAMTEAEAEATHQVQADAFAKAGVDLMSAVTMNYSAESIGIARAAKRAGLIHVLSFTVETDGRLPSGQTLQDARSGGQAAQRAPAENASDRRS